MEDTKTLEECLKQHLQIKISIEPSGIIGTRLKYITVKLLFDGKIISQDRLMIK